MSFRERIAWAAFVTTVIAWGSYFAVVVAWSRNGHAEGHALLWLFIAATIAQIVLMAATAAFAAIRAPGEAKAAADERDRSVGQRASGIAYGVTMAALIGVIVWLHFGLHGPDVIMALIAVFILGEAARFGAKAIGYRLAS